MGYLYLSVVDTKCFCHLCSYRIRISVLDVLIRENGIPLNMLFILGRRLFQSPKKKARAKSYCSHRCEGSISGQCACNISTFLKFLEGKLFRKSLVKSERSDRPQPEKVSYSIRYCTISMFMYVLSEQ